MSGGVNKIFKLVDRVHVHVHHKKILKCFWEEKIFEFALLLPTDHNTEDLNFPGHILNFKLSIKKLFER